MIADEVDEKFLLIVFDKKTKRTYGVDYVLKPAKT